LSTITTEGHRVDTPPLESITPDCIAYWATRMSAAQNPLLRGRYGDLVWEFSEKTTGRRPPIEAARTAIDGYVEAIVDGLCEPFDGSGDIQKRALDLAASVDAERLKKAIGKLQVYAAAPANEEEREFRQRELFGRLMQLRGSRRPDDELKALAADLRARLNKLVEIKADHFTVENVALPLADYYRSTQQVTEAEEMLRAYGAAVERTVDTNTMAMVATGWLTRLHDLYQRFGMHDDARKLLITIQTQSARINDELIRVSHSTTVPQEKLDEAIDSLINGTKTEALRKIAMNFVPSVNDTERLVKDIASETILMNVFTQQVVAEDGRTTASVGPIGEDLEGHVVLQLGKTMQFLGQLFRPTMEQAVTRHDLKANDFVEWLGESPLYLSDRMQLLNQAFASYLNGNWAMAVHLAIPQIENALRQVLVLHGQPLIRPHRNGTFLLKNLDELLRDSVTERALPKDVRVYLRTLLCDQRGLNVRNNVCHGLWPAEYFNWFIADLVIHAVLVLGLMRPPKADAAAPHATKEAANA
jgi:hypothetical protein